MYRKNEKIAEQGKCQYTPEELEKLHERLYLILGEVVRVCEKWDIPYFIQGGSGIGAFFEQAILPWDDDIDVGMTRENYNRFLKVAPMELKGDFFLQWLRTDSHTPFYFAKVRLHNTAFVEQFFSHVDIHHGIYIDIFPYDKVPDNLAIQKAQRFVANFLNGCLIGKEVWQWKYFGHCDVEVPRQRGRFACLMTRLVNSILTKTAIYRLLCLTQGLFNHWPATYYNMVLMPRDHISVESIRHLQTVTFGPLKVKAPANLECYLKHHYPNLRRHIPVEEQENHHPLILSFDEK